MEDKYNKIWEKKSSLDRPIVEKGSRIDIALKLLESGDKLLDIGCGDGTLGYYAKTKYKEVYGVDISEKALDIAKNRGVITFKVDLNKDRLPFPDDYFDAVTCLDVLEHVIDPRILIKEIRRVLKRRGILIISTPNIRYWKYILTLVLRGKFPKTSTDTELWDGGHLHYFTFKDVEDLLITYDFEIVKKCGVFGKDFLKEFRSPGIIIKAVKR